MLRHLPVHLVSSRDELSVELERVRLPREIEGIDGDALAARTDAGSEARETEGLGRRGRDDLLEVDIHLV